jgi:hypothetical protein
VDERDKKASIYAADHARGPEGKTKFRIKTKILFAGTLDREIGAYYNGTIK